MEERPELLNHLGTIHACAQLSLAEASSGAFLLEQFEEIRDEVIPVIRKTTVKYSTPANGTLYSKARFSEESPEVYLKEIRERGRCVIPVKVDLFNEEHKRTLSAIFEWFITNL